MTFSPSTKSSRGYTSKVKLIGVSGSLRQGSFNASLLRAATELMPQGAELRIGTIRGIPLYDADDEAEQGIPAAVIALKDGIASADGLLLVTPEYNNSIPGVTKNESTGCRARQRTSGASSVASRRP